MAEKNQGEPSPVAEKLLQAMIVAYNEKHVKDFSARLIIGFALASKVATEVAIQELCTRELIYRNDDFYELTLRAKEYAVAKGWVQ